MTDSMTLVVGFVGSVLVLSVGIIGAIAGFTDRPIPDVMQNIAIGSLTLLGGLLAPSPVRDRRIETHGEAGASDMSALLVVGGLVLIGVDVFVATTIALTVIGVLMILAGVALHFLRR